MGVVNTEKIIKAFIKLRKDKPKVEHINLQRELLCEPIASLLQSFDAMQLHQYLLEQGLFHPDANIEDEVITLEKNKVWHIVQEQYSKLRKLWNGAKVSIFIFPVERRNPIIMNELKGKMGIGFEEVIVLFLSKELSRKEISALFTHEYHHVCRLKYLKKSLQEVSLLDSLLIEGMAEVAVEYYHGNKSLAPWVNMYSREEVLTYWKKIYSNLQIKGKEKHDPVLFGDQHSGFPKWFGYWAGYQIVNSYIKNHQGVTMKQLLMKDSNEILNGSSFLLQ